FLSVLLITRIRIISLFFFKPTPPTDIYTLSLHDALPILVALTDVECYRLDKESFKSILVSRPELADGFAHILAHRRADLDAALGDRKSTRLNSSHDQISYAVFCLKKKKTKKT